MYMANMMGSQSNLRTLERKLAKPHRRSGRTAGRETEPNNLLPGETTKGQRKIEVEKRKKAAREPIASKDAAINEATIALLLE